MFTTNPFAVLSASISPAVMQTYVVIMIILVAGGTLLDMAHKKSATYFFDHWRKTKNKAARQVGGGEMVSLAAVEELSMNTWPGFNHAVISLPDEKKGEKIVLITENKHATRKEIQEYARKHKIGELYIPKKVVLTESMPMLSTGKTDYRILTDLALTEDKAGSGWKIYDVELQGVSIVQTYRSQFDGVMKDGTIDDLMARLRKSGEFSVPDVKK